ncbi:jg13986 [Pararge aegeria aegeria]|uniref:Jg13986 protein n=1 Tax=Pararge aegeria aegeria TaxID=348720 RepID=A0A8S4RC71_9NEOP|nr:jg13986 [Pararge aegeria aegeria]
MQMTNLMGMQCLYAFGHERSASCNMPPCAHQFGVGVKPRVPLITPENPPGPEYSISTILLSDRNKHGDSTSPDEL